MPHDILLLSYSRDGNYTLTLAEFIGKNYHNLISIFKDIMYLYPFKAKIKGYNSFPTNIEDFNYIIDKYEMKKCMVIYPEPKNNSLISFYKPILFNRTTNKPIFTINMTFPRYRNPSSHSLIKDVFVLLPSINPIVRGNIIEKCIDIISHNNFCFVCTGDVYYENKIKISDLYMRYLISRGIDENNAIKLFDMGEFPDMIDNIRDTLSSYFDCQTRVFICTQHKNMHKTLKYLRKSPRKKKVLILNDKL